MITGELVKQIPLFAGLPENEIFSVAPGMSKKGSDWLSDQM